MNRKKSFVLLLFICTLQLFSQNGLTYNKTVAECEEQWIVCPKGADSAYQFGFVFADKGGLTFRLEGAFTIDKSGNYFRLPAKKVNQQANLTGSLNIVSLIPNGKYAELKIGVFPSWYDVSTSNGDNVFKLYTEGYVANAKGNYANALVPLNKAYLLNPDYKSVRYQFALALNARGLYSKADTVLQEALITAPKSYLLYQELSFAQLQQGKIILAEKSAKLGIKHCKINEPRCKIALRLTVHYFEKKDSKNFNYWMKQTRKYAVDGGVQARQVNDMLVKSQNW